MTSSLSSARWWSIATLVLCLVGATATVSAQSDAEEQARGHFRLGRAHYDNGDFLRAAQEFEAAFAISLHSQLLYNIYLAYRDANVTSKAAEALKGYLEQVADVPNRAQLAARLESLQQALASAPPTTTPTGAAATGATSTETAPDAAVTGTSAPTETTGATATTSSATTSGGGGNKLVPIILMGAGGALIVGGVITGIMTSGKESDLAKLCPDMTCGESDRAAAEDLQSSGNTLALVTDILLFGGIAAAGTGAVLFLLSGGEESSEPPPATASFACAPGMCGGSLHLRF